MGTSPEFREAVTSVAAFEAQVDETLAAIRSVGHEPGWFTDDVPDSPTYGSTVMFDWTAWQRMLGDTGG